MSNLDQYFVLKETYEEKTRKKYLADCRRRPLERRLQVGPLAPLPIAKFVPSAASALVIFSRRAEKMSTDFDAAFWQTLPPPAFAAVR
jgi:hypothetical protein